MQYSFLVSSMSMMEKNSHIKSAGDTTLEMC